MSSRTSLLAALAASLLAIACTDPDARFDDFGDRVPDAAPVPVLPDAAPLDEIPNVTGEFLMAFSTPIAPTLPIQFIMESELEQEPGVNTLSVVFQPLAVADRMPVGDPIVVDPVDVNAAGEFLIVAGDVFVPGAANPISGSDIRVDIELAGAIRSDSRLCGVLDGMVTSPAMIDLTGSTWSSIRVTAGTVGETLPAPELACPSSN